MAARTGVFDVPRHAGTLQDTRTNHHTTQHFLQLLPKRLSHNFVVRLESSVRGTAQGRRRIARSNATAACSATAVMLWTPGAGGTASKNASPMDSLPPSAPSFPCLDAADRVARYHPSSVDVIDRATTPTGIFGPRGVPQNAPVIEGAADPAPVERRVP